MRSKLFVPASRPELFTKALVGEADALSFDLEDAVAEARKDKSAGDIEQFSLQPAARTFQNRHRARQRHGDAPFLPDIAAVVREGVHLINLPRSKVSPLYCRP